jgi:hypothetical protein
MMGFVAALQSLRPGASWTLEGDSYAGLVWLDDSVAPTEAEILDRVDVLAAQSAEAEAAHLAAHESAVVKLADLGITAEEVIALTT